MIDRELAKGYIGRLCGLPFPPPLFEGWTALIDSLARVSEDESHAEKIVDSFKGAERCPSVGDIEKVAWETRSRDRRPDSQCPRCGGTGFRIIERRGLTGAERCNCDKLQPRGPDPQDPPDPRSTETTRDSKLAKSISIIAGKKAG